MKTLFSGLIAFAALFSFSTSQAAHIINAGRDSKVKMVVYGDYQCPFTAKLSGVIDQIKIEYPDVAIYFAHFPLSFHDQAVSAAIASVCADRQGLFWSYSKALFHNQAKLAEDYYPQLADALQIQDRNAFASCLKEPGVKSQVELEFLVGEATGVSGTPTIFVNGEAVRGAYPFSHYKEIIDRLLAE